MAYKPRESKCEWCFILFTKKAAKSRFCSRICGGFSESQKRKTLPEYKEYREKNKNQILSLAKKHKNSKEWSEKIDKSNRRKRNIIPENIYQCSPRTRLKIFKRLEVKCCICGWNIASCDIHHINGKKITNYNHHSNLTILCPNHHREFHSGLIGNDQVKTFEIEYGDKWKEYYYG